MILEPHVCKVCFGRIAREGDVYTCTSCGHSAKGDDSSVVCACGITMRDRRARSKSGGAMVNAGIRCHENRSISAEFPSLFVASYQGKD